MDSEFVKPFLKWVGGKTQIIDSVMTLFPTEMRSYHEPFVGGGSVLLALLTLRSHGIIEINGDVFASDVNPNLIGLYQNIQANPAALIHEVKLLTDAFTAVTGTTVNRKAVTAEEAVSSPESYYFWIRTRFNAIPVAERNSVAASAMMLFLNKTCFRGVYREGPHGFNVPFGNYKNPAILDEVHILAVSELIQGVTFTCASFQTSLDRVAAGDFVYLDPPYAPVNETSFVSYTADNFGLERHKELFQLCRGLKGIGAKMLMSNAAVPLVKRAFPAPYYTMQTISCRRSIHSKNPEARADEVLIQG